MAGPEKKFENNLRLELNRKGLALKLHGGQFQRDMPDVMFLYKGQTIFIEVKATKKRFLNSEQILGMLSPGQMYQSSLFKKHGCAWWVAAGNGKAGFIYRMGDGRIRLPHMSVAELAKKILEREE